MAQGRPGEPYIRLSGPVCASQLNILFPSHSRSGEEEVNVVPFQGVNSLGYSWPSLIRAFIRMPYQWDSVPSYRLQYAIVNQFLMELFGNYDFYTQVNSTLGLLCSNILRKSRNTLMLTVAVTTPAFQRPHSILDPQGSDRCKTSHTLSICKPTDFCAQFEKEMLMDRRM
jgi:hypothetical protein